MALYGEQLCGEDEDADPVERKGFSRSAPLASGHFIPVQLTQVFFFTKSQIQHLMDINPR